MIIKKMKDFKVVKNDACGQAIEILNTKDYEKCSIAIFDDVKESQGHFHQKADEIYWLQSGQITLQFFDSLQERRWEELLEPEELVVIPAGLHHKVIKSSAKNKLIVISVPRWTIEDQLPSKKV